jgi:hypothetical protein
VPDAFVAYLIDHGDVIIPVITVVTLAVAGFITNQRRERREFTQRLMATVLEQEHLAHADYLIYQFMMQAHGPEADGPPRKCPVKDLQDTLQEAIRMTLNYYQMVAASFQRGILDRKFVLRVRGAYMRRLFLYFEDHINETRRGLGRPELYRELEILVRREAARYEARNCGDPGGAAGHMAGN